MRITEQHIPIPFRAIKLSDKEKQKTDELLQSLKLDNNEKSKSDIFVILDKHLQKEASKKVRLFHYTEDFLQNLYLALFEKLEQITQENITALSLISYLNSICPDEDDLKPEFNRREVSFHNMENFFSEDRVKTYASQKSEEERAVISSELDKRIKSKSQISADRQELLEQKATGESYTSIAKRQGESCAGIRKKIVSTVAQIQYDNDILPSSFDEFAAELKYTYNLRQSTREITKKIIKLPYLVEQDTSVFIERINKTAELLNVPKEKLATLYIEQVQLFGRKPESISANVSKTAQLLGVKKEQYLQSAMMKPVLFCYTPEKINTNIENLSQLLEIPREKIIKTGLKHPQILYQKPETLAKNVDLSASLLGIERKTFIKAALVQPPLFYQSPQTLNQKAETCAILFGLSKKEYLKIAIRQPQLLYALPETINKRVESSARLLGISKEEFVKLSSKEVAFLILKPENILQKVEEYARQMAISKEEAVQLIMKEPLRISRNPKNVERKIELIKYFKLIKGEPTDKIPFYTWSEKLIYHKILKYLVLKNDNKMLSISDKEYFEHLNNSDKIYTFIIPESDFSPNLINFANEFSQEYFGKKLFNFEIK